MTSASVRMPIRRPSSSRTGSVVNPLDANSFAAYFTVVSGVTVTAALLMMSRACIEDLLSQSVTFDVRRGDGGNAAVVGHRRLGPPPPDPRASRRGFPAVVKATPA